MSGKRRVAGIRTRNNPDALPGMSGKRRVTGIHTHRNPDMLRRVHTKAPRMLNPGRLVCAVT